MIVAIMDRFIVIIEAAYSFANRVMTVAANFLLFWQTIE